MSNLNEYLNAPMKSPETIWIASFDIGHINFAFYIKEINQNKLSQIKNIKKEERYNEDGTPTVKMNNILNKIYLNGKEILHKNLNISQNCKKDKYFDQEVLFNLNNVLDEHSLYWDKCSYFVVEQQMAFKGKINTMALKIGQHCQSYFIFRYGRFKTVIEFPSYYKTSVLGSQKLIVGKTKTGKIKYKNIDKPARKKWSILKAREILSLRGDTTHPIVIAKRGVKLDDMADTLIQQQAFIYKMFIDKSLN